jgi:hypothetical protein
MSYKVNTRYSGGRYRLHVEDETVNQARKQNEAGNIGGSDFFETLVYFHRNS